MVRRVIAASALLVCLAACSDTPTPPVVDLDDSQVEPGWGPDRPFYGAAEAPSGAVLNSASEGTFGAEYLMSGVRPAGTEEWTSEVTLEPGGEYEGYLVFHNIGDAAATGARLSVELPAIVNSRQRVNHFVEASNTRPLRAWGSYVITTGTVDAGVYAVRVVPDSVTVWLDEGQRSVPGSVDALLGRGQPVGCQVLDGTVEPGCAGWITYRFVADQPSFEISQWLRHPGGQWEASLEVEAGSEVEVLLAYKNTGTTQQDDVVLRVEMPPQLRLVEGTTELGNATTPDGAPVSDNIAARGINVGSYSAGANAWVILRVAVSSDGWCAISEATITTAVETANGTKHGGADLYVSGGEGECGP